MYIYSQHPYYCVNNIVLTLFLKQSKVDVLICSLNLFHSHGKNISKKNAEGGSGPRCDAQSGSTGQASA